MRLNTHSGREGLSGINFSSKNNLPTFRLNVPVVIREKVQKPTEKPLNESLRLIMYLLTRVQMTVQNALSLMVCIFQTVDATVTAIRFVLLNRQDFNFSLLFLLLEHIVQEACYIHSKLLNIAIESNTNAPQDGGRMYPSCDFTFIMSTMNSFILYVKGQIIYGARRLRMNKLQQYFRGSVTSRY